jgi:hypothetical protein
MTPTPSAGNAGTLVRIPEAAGVSIEGSLEVPDVACGVVLFAHGSGSSRFSPRNNFVAAELRRAGMTTLLLDLLTAKKTIETRFEVALSPNG